MEISKKFLHDRLMLLLITILAVLVAIGVSTVLVRFDVAKNPTTIVAYRPNISGSSYQSGKAIDIYSLAVFMVITASAAALIGNKVYALRRELAGFTLSAGIFLLILSIIVANALISLQ